MLNILGIMNIIQAERIHNKPSIDGITEEMISDMKQITEWVVSDFYSSNELES